jgi:hypothetical protein
MQSGASSDLFASNTHVCVLMDYKFNECKLTEGEKILGCEALDVNMK